MVHGQTGTTNIELNGNEKRVLELVRRGKGISRSALVMQTSLNQSSVHRIVEHLAEQGYLNIGESVPNGRGKPSPAVMLNPAAVYGFGISVNSDSVTASLVNFCGDVVNSEVLDIIPQDPSRTLIDIKYHYLNILKKHGIPPDKVSGIGYSMAGFMYTDRRYFNPPEPLKNWLGIDLGREIHTLFDKPVWVENNGSTGAYAEAFLGAGLRYKTFGYLSFNYGFGGGVVIDGKLFSGAFGNAGEISRIYSPQETSKRPALGLLIDRLNRGGIEIHNIRELRDNFDPNWPIAQEWVDEVTPYLDRAIDAFKAVIDPEAIVFGGEIPLKLGKMFMDKRRPKVDERWNIPAQQPELMLSAIQGDSASIGAALTPVRDIYFS